MSLTADLNVLITACGVIVQTCLTCGLLFGSYRIFSYKIDAFEKRIDLLESSLRNGIITRIGNAESRISRIEGVCSAMHQHQEE